MHLQGIESKREALLDDVDKIAPVLQACGANSEQLGALSPETVIASRTTGMVKLRLCTEMGGSKADRVTEMMVLEQFAYLERLFTDGNVRTAAISFFRAGRAVSDRNGRGVSGRWRFNAVFNTRSGCWAERSNAHSCKHRWLSPGDERHSLRTIAGSSAWVFGPIPLS